MARFIPWLAVVAYPFPSCHGGAHHFRHCERSAAIHDCALSTMDRRGLRPRDDERGELLRLRDDEAVSCYGLGPCDALHFRHCERSAAIHDCALSTMDRRGLRPRDGEALSYYGLRPCDALYSRHCERSAAIHGGDSKLGGACISPAVHTVRYTRVPSALPNIPGMTRDPSFP